MASRPANLSQFEMRRILKPRVQGGLSSTLIVDGVDYVNVAFNTKLIRRVGKVLPRGVSKDDPAFMSIRFDIAENRYMMYAQYINDEPPRRYHFLTINERPEWLSKPKRARYAPA